MFSPDSKSKIALIHNTNVHVEIAISLYFTLERSERWSPTLILLPKDCRGLNTFLDQLGVRYLTSGFSSDEYTQAIVVTSYPAGAEYKRLYNENHPMVRGFEGRRVLVTHRANYPVSAYRGEKVMGLTPLCEKYGIPFYYACENPALEGLFLEDWNDKVFLVQGKFGCNHRSFECLKQFLDTDERTFRVRLLGQSASTIALSDQRVEVFEGVSETEFYDLCRTSHFILPLVDEDTRRGQYLRCRFSSTYSIAFASQKPLVAGKGINEIYDIPAFIYRNSDEFCSAMSACVSMRLEDYIAQYESYTYSKKRFREHNFAVLETLLK